MIDMSMRIHIMEFEQLHQSMENFQGNTEKVINNVLHEEAAPLISDAVKRLMPRSGAKWKGKKAAAADANSLMNKKENLAITVKTKKAYQYLYFPDDGTNTRRHVGNQQFFRRGGESQTNEIINRCIKRLTNDFE